MSGLVSIKGWASWEIDRVWYSIQHLVQQAYKAQERYSEPEERFDIPGLYNKIKASEWQLWTINYKNPMTGIVVTGIELNTSGAKELTIYWVAGSHIRESLPTYFRIEDWARSQGCSVAKTRVRAGIAPLMEIIGFNKKEILQKGILMTKDL